jgi:uncharacterized protein YjbI with pentapeptide repeats
VAVAGLIVSTRTASKRYREERNKDRRASRQLHRQEKRAQDEANRRRFDERFAQAVESLDAGNPAHRIAAVVLISSMLREPDRQLADQAFALLVGSLQRHRDSSSDVTEGVAAMLLPVLEGALRTLAAERPGRPLDLTRLRAARINLTGLYLNGSDLAFADLSRSSLSSAGLSKSDGFALRLVGSTLNQAVMREVRWHCVDAQLAKFKWATLTSAELRRGDFRGADFFQAQLQSAHFERADLRGARFDRATLTDTFFVGAQFDEVALRSILRAKNPERAVFDETTEGHLFDLTQD